MTVPQAGRAARRHSRRLHAPIEPLEQRTLFAVIDTMVLYSNNALAGFGNDNGAIQKAIRQSIDAANLAHLNTGDDVVIRLVHTENLNYSSTASQSTQLSFLQTDPGVAALRTLYGADLVSMIVDSPQGGGGLGNLLQNPAGSPSQAFNVVGYQGIGPGSFVLAHEEGHNLGGGHERDNASSPAPGIFSYSYGYHATGAHGSEYGDVMSYQGKQIGIFSTPTVTHDGTPMGKPAGDPNEADLRTTFLTTGPVVAGYFPSLVPDAAPTATLKQEDLVGDQLTLKVRYVDDVSVNASTFSNGDVYVQTPEGFKLQAEYLGADRPGNVYATLATYRVTLPRNLPALSSLGVFVNPGAVTDTNNTPVTAGQVVDDLDGDSDFGLISPQLAADTGTLTIGDTRRLTGRVAEQSDIQDIYKFTVTQNESLNMTLTGVGWTSGVSLFLFRDNNLNEVVANEGETVPAAGFSSGANFRSLKFSLTPGTYYAYLQPSAGQGTSTYTLTMETPAPAVGDTTAPTALLDAVDTAAPSLTVDFAVLYRDDNGLDLGSLANAKIDVTLGGAVGGAFTLSPAGTTVIDSKSAVVTYTTSFAGGNPLPAGSIVSMKVGAASGVKDGSGNNIATGTALGSYTIAPAGADTTAPSALLFTAPSLVVPNGTAPSTYTFTVAYRDNRAMPSGTIGAEDLLVSGPGGFNQPATYTGQTSTLSPIGGIRLATYTITAPGGSWDWTDDGNYNVNVVGGEIFDGAGNGVPGGSIGQIKVDIDVPGDADHDRTVGPSDFNLLASNFGLYGRGVRHGDFDFDGIVGPGDFNILATRFGTTVPFPILAPPPTVAAASPAKASNAPILNAPPTTTSRKPVRRLRPVSPPKPVTIAIDPLPTSNGYTEEA